VLRSADAFGASCVALGPGTADPFSPKAVRASMGAVFGVPVARVDGAQTGTLPGTRIALVAGAGPSLAEVWRSTTGEPSKSAKDVGVTLLIGAEREGLPPELVHGAERTAQIPIQTHSLNAAMAATVALYELTRKIRMAPPA
jgi:TrmH family RNA methyltransferase